MPYSVGYATRQQFKCEGCKSAETPILKGELQFGPNFTLNGNVMVKWRHLGCVSQAQIGNIKKRSHSGSEFIGFEELKAEDKQKVHDVFGWTTPIPAQAPLREQQRPAEPTARASASGWGDVTASWDETTKVIISQSQDSHSEPDVEQKKVEDNVEPSIAASSTTFADPPDVVSLQLEVYEAHMNVAAAEMQVAEAKLKLERAKASVLEYKVDTMKI